MAGFGIWQMYVAKKHIDEVCKQINFAKNEMIKETAGEHHHRPGDTLIRQAFEGLTEMYFGKLQVQWESDLQEFISEYSLMDLTKKSPKVEKQALATIGRLKGHLQKIEGLFTGFKNNLEQAF